MNELSKRKVVEHNSLITSIAKMDKTPLKMFELAVSLNDSNKHSRFKDAIEKEQDKGFKYTNIVPIPYVEWTDYNDEVKIEFHREIMPYLINLKNNFTQHALSDIAELNSKYTIILYRWLSMNYNQYEHYSVKGGRRKQQIEDYRSPEMSIQELRQMTDTVNEYKRFYNFEKWVLKEPLSEITSHTTLNVTYEKLQ